MLSLLGAGRAAASSLETLVMPGPLIQGHARYEAECSRCHAPFKKGGQRPLCLACHDKVAADIKTGKGFHGHAPAARERECKTCHTDHAGRGADIVKLDRETFDHRLTDYPLKGAHGNVACAACHLPGKAFRAAPTDCLACHRADDVHKGQLGKACADCHSEAGWRDARFDHARTDFPLTGRHAKVDCAGCHPDRRFSATPTDCLACHRLDDRHAGRYGTRCDTCHRDTGWRDIAFDHDHRTHYPLRGRHVTVACDACHRGDLYKDKPGTACVDCHRDDDAHRGRNGPACAGCHDERGWKKVAFDHDRDTHFPLQGVHARQPCDACHRGRTDKVKLDTACAACHKADDVHRGQEGADCARCHGQDSWSAGVRFDHDLTRFPLIGQHAAAPCEECHLSPAFKDAKLDCVACHHEDDSHKGALGTACGSCHNPNGWALWRFDHNHDTDFALDGAHTGLACNACHTRAGSGGRPGPVARTCVGCHQGDDPHLGRFGAQCERCHVTESFKDIRVNR